jgi:ABC transporter substrate binding protein
MTFRIGRREFIALLGGAGWPLTARAQQPAVKIPRAVAQIGVLWPVDEDEVLVAFRQALRELGYIEGQNIVYEYRSSRGDDARLPALASELVRLDVDLIVTWGVTAGRIAKEATTSIPIVNGSMSDPVRAHLVNSLARPVWQSYWPDERQSRCERQETAADQGAGSDTRTRGRARDSCSDGHVRVTGNRGSRSFARDRASACRCAQVG